MISNHFDFSCDSYTCDFALALRFRIARIFLRCQIAAPAKIPGYPPKGLFPWVSRTYQTFCPPPPHMEDPHSTRRYPDPEVWVCAPFFLPEIFPSLAMFPILKPFTHRSAALLHCWDFTPSPNMQCELFSNQFLNNPDNHTPLN